MERNNIRRPTLLSVIGWCFIALSAIAILSGLFTLVSFTWMNRQIKSTPELMNELPPEYQVVFGFLKLIYVVVVFQIMLSVFLLLVSVEFLKMRGWARTGLEFINWFAILISTELSFFGIVIWILGKAGVMSKLAGLGLPRLFDFSTPALIVLSWTLAAVPLYLVNRVIRRPDIKELFVP